jgi:uncharacterized protein YggE
MKVITIAITMLLLLAGSASAQTSEGTGSVLNVSGSAEVRVSPDLAVVRLGIVAQSAGAAGAQDSANMIANAILDAVRSVGIDEGQVQTARLVLSPLYGRQVPGSNEAPRIVAYRASNTVSVRVEDLDMVGDVIDSGLGAGANQLEGVSFSLIDDLPARQSALREAIVEARSKAEAMAGALGVDLATIVSVSEGNVVVQQPMMEMAAMSRRMPMQVDSATPVSPGEVSINATVSIQYRIQQ